MTTDLVFSRENHIGIITLQRVDALNALTLPMILALQHQLEEWHDADDIHAVAIQSAAAGKAFCAGGDIRWLYDRRSHDAHLQMQFFWHEYRLNHYIHQFKKPYIAFMDGVTMGGGVGISLHGSHPVASERFLFAMPETGIGFFPDIGASYLLSRCLDQYGIYLGLTGARLGMSDAKALGLIKYQIPSSQFENALHALIDSDLSSDPHLCVERCLQPFTMPEAQAPLLEKTSRVNDAFSAPDIESIFSRLSESDEWARDTLHILNKKSPLSLKITLHQLHQAKFMSMAECVKMDYCLVGHFMRDHDFYEGVRALLIDKDKSPEWKPESISKVTSEQVADYFVCGQPELPLLMV